MLVWYWKFEVWRFWGMILSIKIFRHGVYGIHFKSAFAMFFYISLLIGLQSIISLAMWSFTVFRWKQATTRGHIVKLCCKSHFGRNYRTKLSKWQEYFDIGLCLCTAAAVWHVPNNRGTLIIVWATVFWNALHVHFRGSVRMCSCALLVDIESSQYHFHYLSRRYSHRLRCKMPLL